MRPDGLGQIMEMAQLIEDRNNIVNGLRENMGSRVGRVFTAQGGKKMEKGLIENSGPRVSGGFMAHGGKPNEGFQRVWWP